MSATLQLPPAEGLELAPGALAQLHVVALLLVDNKAGPSVVALGRVGTHVVLQEPPVAPYGVQVLPGDRCGPVVACHSQPGGGHMLHGDGSLDDSVAAVAPWGTFQMILFSAEGIMTAGLTATFTGLPTGARNHRQPS